LKIAVDLSASSQLVDPLEDLTDGVIVYTIERVRRAMFDRQNTTPGDRVG